MTETTTEPELTVYRERAHLVAYLARTYEAHWTRDPSEPEWPVICVHTPAGQMTWHVAAADVALFPDVRFWAESDWDGHTTAEKYEWLARLGEIAPRVLVGEDGVVTVMVDTVFKGTS